MQFLLLQSDYFGEKLKAIRIFEKFLEGFGVDCAYIHGSGGKNYRNLEDWLQTNNPSHILISSWCYNNWVLSELLDIIETHSKNAVVILGGWLPNLLGMGMINFHDRIDYIAMGDGEPIIQEIIEGIDLADIKGLYNRNYEGELEYRRFDREKEVFLEGNSIVPLSGCGGKCKFCSILKNKQNFWKKTMDRVKQEIVFQKNNAIDEIYLGYDNVLMNRKNAIEYAKLLKEHQLPFATTGRVDQIDEDLISTLAEYGCVRLDFGIESPSEKVSAHINKNLTKESIFESGRLCKKYNILPFAFVIIGLPSEEEDDRLQTLSFIKDSAYMLFEINLYKDYVRSELADSIKNFDVFATSKYYQYQLCYGIYDSKEECLKMLAAYKNIVNKATYCMIAKFIHNFSEIKDKTLYATYWRSFRDATLDTSIPIKKEWFKNEKSYNDFNYWWRVKQFDNLKKENNANQLYPEKYFVRKDILQAKGEVEIEKISPEEIQLYYLSNYKK